MKPSLSKKMMNIISFQKETTLYRVEPIISMTVCWSDISDVQDMQKSKNLYFSELKGKELYATFVRVNAKSYWKLYIKGIEQMDIVYVQTATLNPVGIYKK